MRFQLPGERRTWGKYAAELLIVAAGVALGLWATEWAAERRAEAEVEGAYEVLKDELEDNYGSLRARQKVEPCIRGRIADLQRWIGDRRSGGRLPLPAEIGQPGDYRTLDSVWDISKAGQVAAAMPLEERRRYAAIYDLLESFTDLQLTERDIWFAIGDFAGRSDFTPSELARLNGLVSRASAIDEEINGHYPTLIKDLALLKVNPPKEGAGGNMERQGICRPFDSLPAA